MMSHRSKQELLTTKKCTVAHSNFMVLYSSALVMKHFNNSRKLQNYYSEVKVYFLQCYMFTQLPL